MILRSFVFRVCSLSFIEHPQKDERNENAIFVIMLFLGFVCATRRNFGCSCGCCCNFDSDTSFILDERTAISSLGKNYSVCVSARPWPSMSMLDI